MLTYAAQEPRLILYEQAFQKHIRSQRANSKRGQCLPGKVAQIESNDYFRAGMEGGSQNVTVICVRQREGGNVRLVPAHQTLRVYLIHQSARTLLIARALLPVCL